MANLSNNSGANLELYCSIFRLYQIKKYHEIFAISIVLIRVCLAHTKCNFPLVNSWSSRIWLTSIKFVKCCITCLVLFEHPKYLKFQYLVCLKNSWKHDIVAATTSPLPQNFRVCYINPLPFTSIKGHLCTKLSIFKPFWIAYTWSFLDNL